MWKGIEVNEKKFKKNEKECLLRIITGRADR
jgi:hypothetical protein